MTLALIILSGFTVGLWFAFFLPSLIARSLPAGPVTPPTLTAQDGPMALVMLVARCTFAAGLVVGVSLYYGGLSVAERLRRLPGINLLYGWISEQLFVGMVLEQMVVGAVWGLAWLAAGFDRVANFVIRGVGSGARFLGRMLKNFDRVMGFPADAATRVVGRLLNM